MNKYTAEQVNFIDKYIDLVVDQWRIQIDHEDGSTAPFTQAAIEEIEGKKDRGNWWWLRT